MLKTPGQYQSHAHEQQQDANTGQRVERFGIAPETDEIAHAREAKAHRNQNGSRRKASDRAWRARLHHLLKKSRIEGLSLFDGETNGHLDITPNSHLPPHARNDGNCRKEPKDDRNPRPLHAPSSFLISGSKRLDAL